jgi:hypothetical protein
MRVGKLRFCAALAAGLVGTGVRADDKAADVTTLPVTQLGATDEPARGEAKPTQLPATAGPVAPTAAVVPVQPGGWYAGAGLVFLRPYVSNNTAYTLTNATTGTAIGNFPLALGTALDAPFNYSHGVGCQAWVGWTDTSGWGCRLGAFCFDEGSELLTLVSPPGTTRLVSAPPVIPAIPGTAGFGAPTSVLAAAGIGTDQLAFQTDLEIDTIDLEGTYTVADRGYRVLFSAGVRWTTLRQEYHAALNNPGDGTTFENQRLDSAREFNGAGPTVAVNLRYGPPEGLSGYGGLRGAILFGTMERPAAFAQEINDPLLLALVGSQRTRTRFASTSDHVMTVGELEAGVEYGMLMGTSRAFVRGGLVAQAYIDAGSATGATGTLGLFGAVLAVGVDY